ncbi:MAG: ABC transporter permease [Imperialibacter sp.]|uniref:ABC transporter permease n=1 Tax=Imperialibacter sp. TaxID=2038411 RepID=UPI0032EDA09E
MSKRRHISPGTGGAPKWASRLLEWYCRPSLYEDLQGDLLEYFERNREAKGVGYARLIYIIDVLKFFRLYTVQKPQIFKGMNQFILLSNYFKTSVRSMARNKLFSTINVVGLAISMSVGLLMIAFLTDIYSFDTFHEKYDRIYRVGNTYQRLEEDQSKFASTSIQAASRIKSDIPGIEEMVLITRNFRGDAAYNNKIIAIEGLYAEPSFFSVFSFKLKQGDAATLLKEPYSVVLDETTAKKLFDDRDPVGELIKLNDKDSYTVTGVMEDMPGNSHLRAPVVASYSTYEIKEKENEESTRLTRWNNMWSNYIYLVVRPDQDIEALQASLNQISAEENEVDEHTTINMWLQPMSAIVPGEDLSNQIGPSFELKMVWIITVLAFVVLVSACFNYTNLSIARSLRRSKEVGIRKVIGASGGNVFGQFILEAVVISGLSLVFAFILYYTAIRPRFLGLSEEISEMITLLPSPLTFFYFLLLAIVTGVVAGFFPALFFSRISVHKVLKDVSSLKLFGNVTFRKVLIVFQYTLSLAFIIGATMAYKQYDFAVNFDLGYKTDNILNIDLLGNDVEKVKTALSEIPEITDMSASTLVTSVGSYWGTKAKYKDPLDSASIHYNGIDENYIPIHGLEIIAGRNFIQQSDSSAESQIIVNEKLLQRFNIGEPLDAIGETLKVDDKDVKIVGVVKDFHYGKIDSPIKEFAYRYKADQYYVINALISSSDIPGTMEKIESKWDELDAIHPFEAEFYDDRIQKSYEEYLVMVKIIGFLAFLAISIASLGLLGMVVFTTETRLKEISIRKVLGASEQALVFLLGRGFIFLLLISATIAVPATWYFFNQIVFNDLAYKATFGFLELFGGVLVVFGIAALAVGSQTVRAARTNPAETLRNE